MWKPYRLSLEQWAPQGRIIYDKFHVLQDSLRHYAPVLPIMPNSALISTAAMPTGMAIFQPMFINWS